ncbi:hypothetical protein [Paraburkholderia strydomiana]|uniref:hypothetical protein n=1 Tax=Paraburkholderia strydomiana TaxID=1245417 RepID=UPI0038B7035E
MKTNQKREAARVAFARLVIARAISGRGPSAFSLVVQYDPWADAQALVDARETPESVDAWKADLDALTSMLPSLTAEDLELPSLGEVSNSRQWWKSPRVRRIVEND